MWWCWAGTRWSHSTLGLFRMGLRPFDMLLTHLLLHLESSWGLGCMPPTCSIGVAESWMERICVMLCLASCSRSRASRKRWDESGRSPESVQTNNFKNATARPPNHTRQTHGQEEKTGFLALNWKKNRKTSVSKTSQHLGSKVWNSKCSNQICSLKGSQMFGTCADAFQWLLQSTLQTPDADSNLKGYLAGHLNHRLPSVQLAQMNKLELCYK